MDQVLTQLKALEPLLGVTLVGMLATLVVGKFLKTIVITIADLLVKRSKNKTAEELLQVAEEDLQVKPLDEQQPQTPTQIGDK